MDSYLSRTYQPTKAMGYQLSKNLGELLLLYQGDTAIELAGLAAQVSGLFEKNEETAKALLGHVTGTMLPGTLCRHLFDCIVHDSVVRDVQTTGHLAKLLSRLDILAQTSDPSIVGLPNSLFDERSQIERAEFFQRGNVLPIDAKVLEVNGVKEMLQREENAL